MIEETWISRPRRRDGDIHMLSRAKRPFPAVFFLMDATVSARSSKIWRGGSRTGGYYVLLPLLYYPPRRPRSDLCDRWARRRAAHEHTLGMRAVATKSHSPVMDEIDAMLAFYDTERGEKGRVGLHGMHGGPLLALAAAARFPDRIAAADFILRDLARQRGMRRARLFVGKGEGEL